MPLGFIAFAIGNEFRLSQLKNVGINTDGVILSKTVPTGFSDVMSLSGGERTFFFNKGTNGTFSPEDIDIDNYIYYVYHF